MTGGIVMEDYIEGYKVFQNELINEHGIAFEVGECIHTNGMVQAGLVGNGFHMCKNFEDTFRFTDFNETPILCEVIGFGTISSEYQDDYNGYYNIYACSDMYVKRIISREEIIEMAQALNNEDRLERFIKTYKLTEKEKKQITATLGKYDIKVKRAIRYYQYGDKDAYKLEGNNGSNNY